MSTKTNLDGRKKISKTTDGEYEVELDGVVVGYVKKYRERTKVMSGRILVGHTESTRWQYRTVDENDRASRHRGYSTRGDAIYAMVYAVDSQRRRDDELEARVEAENERLNQEHLEVLRESKKIRNEKIEAIAAAESNVREAIYRYATERGLSDDGAVQHALDVLAETTVQSIDDLVDESKGF